jgi:hypothetical protein
MLNRSVKPKSIVHRFSNNYHYQAIRENFSVSTPCTCGADSKKEYWRSGELVVTLGYDKNHRCETKTPQ